MQKTQNPLRKLSKLQLLELLAQQEKELQDLRKELAEKEAALADRCIQIENAGSIAEAALRINEVFEAAQKAAEQYLESIKAKQMTEETEA
jgi:Skp family chaperone for outer membrane proteins